MGWIGVDLDGTLAEYHGWEGPSHIGAPVPAMVNRVRRWLDEDQDVRIFTARISGDSGPAQLARIYSTIYEWCKEHLGTVLPITNVKDFQMIELWDNRCVQVEENTGRALGPSRRGLDG